MNSARKLGPASARANLVVMPSRQPALAPAAAESPTLARRHRGLSLVKGERIFTPQPLPEFGVEATAETMITARRIVAQVEREVAQRAERERVIRLHLATMALPIPRRARGPWWKRALARLSAGSRSSLTFPSPLTGRS